MMLKSGAKFEEKLTFCFKNDNCVNFDPNSKNSKKNALSSIPFVQMCKVYNVRPKKIQRSYNSRH